MSRVVHLYKIENTVTSQVYIGTSLKPERRCTEHFNMLEDGEHHSYKLQKAYDQFGKDAFKFEVVGTCDEHNRDSEEHELIVRHNAYKEGYNVAVPANNSKGSQLNLDVSTIVLKVKDLADLDMQSLAVHNFMKQRYDYCVKIGQPYIETRDEVANALGISGRTITRVLARMSDYIINTTEYSGGLQAYVVKDL